MGFPILALMEIGGRKTRRQITFVFHPYVVKFKKLLLLAPGYRQETESG